MKKIILTIFIFVAFSTLNHANLSFDTETQSYLDYKINRLVIINSINLEPNQQKDVAAVFKKYDNEDYLLLNRYNDEKAKLDDLKRSKVGFKSVWAQKKVVRTAKKELKAHYKQVDKNISELLTRTQKVQFRTVSKSFH